MIVTVRPRSTSSRPNEAAAMPLPSDDTTPPVTKMKRVAWGLWGDCITTVPGEVRTIVRLRAEDLLPYPHHQLVVCRSTTRPWASPRRAGEVVPDVLCARADGPAT